MTMDIIGGIGSLDCSVKFLLICDICDVCVSYSVLIKGANIS